jgi:hypothetical protein
MVQQLKQWQTRTRNKILVAGLIFIAFCDLLILVVGWLILDRPGVAAILAVLNGPGGLWAGINAVAIAIEKSKLKRSDLQWLNQTPDPGYQQQIYTPGYNHSESIEADIR